MKNLKRISAVIILFCLSSFSNGYASEPSTSPVPDQRPVKGFNNEDQDMGMNPNLQVNREKIIVQNPAAGPLSRPDVAPPVADNECPGLQCAHPEEPRKLGMPDKKIGLVAIAAEAVKKVLLKRNKQRENTGTPNRLRDLARPE